MPAYVVALIASISDPDTYKRYVAQVEATLEPFGGRFLARAPGPEALEGGPAPSRAVVLQFPDESAARAWHASPAYQPVMALRQSASTGSLLLLPAYNGGAAGVAIGDVYYTEAVTPDPRAAAAFLEDLHGWRFEEMGPELGGSRLATLATGARFAVRGPLRPDEDPLIRTYVRVESVDEAVKRAEKLGAKIGLSSMELPGHGKIAIYFLGGVELGLWELP